MILALPFLIYLFIFNVAGFDSAFYQQKFLEYRVEQDVPHAKSLHEKVINFIRGNNNEIPTEFNEREKQHLLDVRKVIRFSTIALYIFIILFILLLIASAIILKVNNHIISFVGKILFFGGFLTILLAGVLLFFIVSDFPKTFESFHRLFFWQGNYLFDLDKDLIVNLYPERLFMDLGVKISKGVVITASISILIGAFLVLRSKKVKKKK